MNLQGYKKRFIVSTIYLKSMPPIINEILSICARKIQSSQSMCLACLNFLIDIGFCMVFREARGGVTER